MAKDILADLDSSGIYQIRNQLNGKTYIGSAVCFRKRWNAHKHHLEKGKHHSLHMQRSWDKHGVSAFSFEVLEYCEEHQLIFREQHWIDNRKPEYNIAQVAGSTLGIKHPLSTRLRRSELNRGNKFCVGREVSERTKEAVAESNRRRKGSKRCPEAVAMTAAKHRGMKRSEETKRRISEAMTGKKRKPYTEKTIALLREANIGKGVLSESDVRLIRAKRAEGVPRVVLAKQYGVSGSMISLICAKKRYNWVKD